MYMYNLLENCMSSLEISIPTFTWTLVSPQVKLSYTVIAYLPGYPGVNKLKAQLLEGWTKLHVSTG